MSGERSPRIAPLDKSPEMQAQRKAFLEETIRDGYFTKVEPGSGIPKVWVTLKFMGVDFEAKGALISVVYAYYFDGSNDYAIVQLKDPRTGRVVGDYYIAQGGLKMRG